jgi:hypothetical protein
MANRFVKRIKSGEIASVDELKAEFKELAKRTHPDLAGPGAGHADFAALRDDYDNALRDFEKHRFGSSSRGRGGNGPAAPGSNPGAFAPETWPCLAILLGRGFPKAPRHEKEALRYEYARWRFVETLGPARRELFDACDAELLAMRATRSPALELPLRVLRLLLDYRGKGLSAMRTEIVLALAELRSDPRVGPGCRDFTLALARELGVGGEIGPA